MNPYHIDHDPPTHPQFEDVECAFCLHRSRCVWTADDRVWCKACDNRATVIRDPGAALVLVWDLRGDA